MPAFALSANEAAKAIVVRVIFRRLGYFMDGSRRDFATGCQEFVFKKMASALWVGEAREVGRSQPFPGKADRFKDSPKRRAKFGSVEMSASSPQTAQEIISSMRRASNRGDLIRHASAN